MQKMNGSNYKKIRIPKLELGNEKKSHDWERVKACIPNQEIGNEKNLRLNFKLFEKIFDF
jgi:hypothetical protein